MMPLQGNIQSSQLCTTAQLRHRNIYNASHWS